MRASLRLCALVGPRGAGKSTVGPLLARELGFAFADADAAFAARVGRSAADYLRHHPEAAFRAVEREVTGELLEQRDLVVATGGGAVLDDTLRRRLAAADCYCILLTAPVAVLAARLALEPDLRPSLTGLPLPREVEALLAQRLPLYREVARTEFDTANASPEAAARLLAARMRAAVR